MSSNNLSIMNDRGINEDSVISTSTNNTNNSFTDTLIQDISKAKNSFLIPRSNKSKIIEDILIYLQSDTNLAINKIQILKYLESLFNNVNFNSEIFMRNIINDNKQLNLYKIIINQFVFYTNPENSKDEEDNYLEELQKLFILILSQITLDKETYKYILSFLIYFINEKNITEAAKKKMNTQNNNETPDEPTIKLNSIHLYRILKLLNICYMKTYNELPNYFFFSGESDSSIIISNKENPKDNTSKKLLNLDDTLCIMLFIKVLPPEYIKSVYSNVTFKILEMRFNDKKRNSLGINMDKDNNIITTYSGDNTFFQLLDSEINCVTIKFYNNKKKKVINSEIYLGKEKKELPPIPFEIEKEKTDKTKDDIKEIILFKNFIGICTNIIIYKEKKSDGLPKFLFSFEEKKSNKSNKDEKNKNNESQKKSIFSLKSIFPNGIYSEELFSYFTKVELKDQVEPNILSKNIIIEDEFKINSDDFKDFFNNNLIAIYMPTRVDICPKNEENSSLNESILILRDSINNLDAKFKTKSPSFNGVHIYSRIIDDDFGILGGIDNLLPIIELMTNYPELLSQENFSLYFNIISNVIFSNLHEKAIKKENDSNFFMNLSYFLEKIPDNYFDNSLIDNFELILAFLNDREENDFYKLNKQFHDYILINEKILDKFSKDDQKHIINTISITAGNRNIEIDFIRIIKLLLYYDRNNKYKFCCKAHADYFNDSYEIMEPELSNLLQPVEKLVQIIFDQKYSINLDKVRNANNNANKVVNFPHKGSTSSSKSLNSMEEDIFEDNNLYYFFYLLTFDISPCLQKSIIYLVTKFISNFTYDYFVRMFDKKKELFDIALYVFKTSIFDVKVDILNLLFLIEEKSKEKNIFDDTEKQIFLKNEIIPIFLLDEVNNLISKNKSQDKEKSDNSQNIKDKEKKNDENNKYDGETKENEVKQDNFNDKVDINNEMKSEIIEEKKEKLENEIKKDDNISEEEKYEFKSEIEIKGVKYILFSPSDIQKKICAKYNKKKFNCLINSLYEKIILYFNNNINLNFKLELLIQVVSKGDLLLIKSFVLWLSELIKGQKQDKKDSKQKKGEEQDKKDSVLIDQDLIRKEFIYNELINNQNLLLWLIEISFQIYILQNQGKEKNQTPFVPGFSINIYKNSDTLEQLEKPYDEKEKKAIFDEVYKKCKEILKFIFDTKIYKFDFILSWSRYYLELKNENSIYNKMNNFINEFIQELFSSSSITTFSDQILLNNPKAKHTLYFINLFFEFFTFYQIEYDKNFFEKGEDKKNIDLIRKISQEFKYILFNKKEKEEKIDYIKYLELFENKIIDYIFIRIVFLICSPIWSGNEKKFVKNEDEIYSKYIIGNSKNSNLGELEILFYYFDDDFLKEYKDYNYCNEGMPLVFIIYHLFISFLNIGGNMTELNEYFKDLRLYILLLIISSSTLNSAELVKKKKWLKEDQYKDIQFTVECILFNFLFYFYHKIKELKNEINEYKSKYANRSESDIPEKDKKTRENLKKLNRIYVENFGYFLKILNKIYRGVKEEENKKQGMMTFFKNMFKSQNEGVKKSGAFLLMEKMYNECSTLNKSETNNLRKTLGDSLDNEINLELNERKRTKNKSFRQNYNTDIHFYNYLISPTPEMDDPIKTNVESKDLNLSVDKEINNNNLNEKNYLDEICGFSFSPKDVKEIKIDDNKFVAVEESINKFLNDKNIEKFYENHYEEYNKDLYPFISFMQKRHSMIEKIIPLYDNRKNISKYPNDLCLIPYYYPENKYLNKLKNDIGEKSKQLNEQIKLNKKKIEVEEFIRCNNYRNTKKKLFKFNSIWSYPEYFYDNETYRLKYKLLNHMTNDFTKILMTPIVDIDYYLPKFSLFKNNIFRNNEKDVIPITKVIDISFGLNDKKKKALNNNTNSNKDKEKQKSENKLEISATSHSSFDSLNNSTSNVSDIKQNANITKQIIPLFELNQECFPLIKESENEENLNSFNEKDYKIFINYIKKKHFGKNKVLFAEACLVKLPFHIRGVVYINDQEIGFYSYETKREGDEDDYDADKKVCFGSIFKGQEEKYNYYYIKIPLEKIELIFKRRYYFKKNVLEFYTQDKKSLFFRIEESKFKPFLDSIKFYFSNELEEITIDYSKYEEKIGFINKNNILYNYNNYYLLFNTKKGSSIRYLYSKWAKWEISTFTLLNTLNIYSNRSYNDPNQYPVFPWIITDYTSKVLPSLDNQIPAFNKNLTLSLTPSHSANLNSHNSFDKIPPLIRPFGTPMGMMDITLDSKERKDNYLDHWQSLENDDDKDENYDRYGSHYSTSLYLTYYLVRVFPFSYIRIELQGKNFDDPNRLFNSVANSFDCAMTQKSDLRELIPEFFCLPEMFYNLNNLNLGEVINEKTKKPVLVNDIDMPPWAGKGDAYMFIKKHREILESIEISEKINEWFNIIFGSKQKGKAARTLGNLFIKQTYEDYDEIHNHLDITDKIYQKRMVEFGVTPCQLFKNDTNKRYPVKDLKKKPILYNYQIKLGKNDNIWNMGNKEELLEIKDSEVYLEGEPFRIYSTLKKNEDIKNEKILFLYQDKIKIISKTNEKGFFKKNKTKENKENKNIKGNKEVKNKENKEIRNVKENEESKETKENEETKEIKEIKENEEEKVVKENEETEENNNKMVGENNNEENNNEEDQETKDEEDNKNLVNKETISKYDKMIRTPKYRMNPELAPTIIYDKGNHIAQGGFWNGHILITNLEDSGNKKDKSQKNNLTIISTSEISPIIHMKMDFSETFVICVNKIGTIFIFIINKLNKEEWTLHKIIQDNQSEITSIDLNENLNIFAVCDINGYINLYTIPTCKLFNSYKLKENILPKMNKNKTDSNNNQNISSNLYADYVIIFHSPLPSLIVYIKSRKSLFSFSINFHLIKEVKLGFEIVPNGIKKYSDYFSKDYLFIYNKNEKKIEVYDMVDLNTNIIARSLKINHTFIDFHFNKEMDHALIMVKINEKNNDESAKDKNEQRNHKIFVLNSPGRGDIKLF